MAPPPSSSSLSPRRQHKQQPTSCIFSLLRRLLPLFGLIFLAACIMSFSVTHQHLMHLEQNNPIMDAMGVGSFYDGKTAGSSVVGTDEQQPAIITSIEYPVEDPIPNIEPPADGKTTFSACMLLMDDNHRLAEWFAYHYHVLPLRYMVVTIDPRSKTSPQFILNRWRRMGVYIEEWKDDDFWKKGLNPIPDDARFQTKRDRHRGRQKFFYKKCMIHLKERNRTWVALHDSDEYLVYNHAGGDKFEAWEEMMQAKHKAHGRKETRIRPANTPPTTAQEGGMIDYIRKEQAANMTSYQSPCIGIPRLQFGTDESTPQEYSAQVPSDFDASIFDTMRYRKHAPRNDFVKNSLGKVIMDVSRIDVAHSPRFYSLHRPIKTICTQPWHNEWEVGLRINHYLGSWESYSFRDDSRRGGERSREQWEYKGFTNGDQTDDNIRPWLDGFVQKHGVQKSQELLQNVGLPKNYRNHNDHQYMLLPDKLGKILNEDSAGTGGDSKRVQFDAWVRNKYKDSDPLRLAANLTTAAAQDVNKEQ